MNRINLLLDNCSTINLKKKNIFYYLIVKVLFLSEYYPYNAPAELLFNMPKRRIIIHAKGSIVNLKKDLDWD